MCIENLMLLKVSQGSGRYQKKKKKENYIVKYFIMENKLIVNSNNKEAKVMAPNILVQQSLAEIAGSLSSLL